MTKSQSVFFANENYEDSMLVYSLKYFKHPLADSCIRIWHLEFKQLENRGLLKLKLFEYGTKKHKESKNNNYAMYSSFEIQGRGEDSIWNITCVKTKAMEPINGWEILNRSIINEKLDKIYDMPKGEVGGSSCSACLLWLQYVLPNETLTLSYTASTTILSSTYPRDINFLKLVRLLNREFNIKLSYNELGGYEELFFEHEFKSEPIDSISK